jgi:hypothetical protein
VRLRFCRKIELLLGPQKVKLLLRHLVNGEVLAS